MVVAMTALCAFVSLGVDLGRVQVAKTELQRAADAAARYAVTGLSRSRSAAITRAIAAAGENQVDTTHAILRNSDVEVGNWGGSPATFTRGGTPQNAVRVTARRTAARGNAIPLLFAQVLGLTHCDVSASAIAVINTGSGTGFIGLRQFNAGNNALVASFDPALGAPGGSNRFSNGTAASNRRLRIGNRSNVHGVTAVGPTGSARLGNNVVISGGQVRLSSNMTYPSTERPTTGSTGSIGLANNQDLTLGAGVYNYSQITTGNNCTITFTGRATVYLTGPLRMGNNCEVYSQNNDPETLDIRVVGAGSLHFGNSPDIFAKVYAPHSRFVAGNNALVAGSIVADRIDFGNSPDLYYDQTLGGAVGTGGAIALVR